MKVVEATIKFHIAMSDAAIKNQAINKVINKPLNYKLILKKIIYS